MRARRPGREQDPHCCLPDTEKLAAERAEACKVSLFSPEGRSGVAATGRKKLILFQFLG